MMTRNNETELIKLVYSVQRAGEDYLKARETSELLHADEPNFLAALMTGIEKTFEGEKVSDAKLERLARATDDFRGYVRGRIAAEIKTLQLKNRLDNLTKLWESKRSDQSFEREKVSKGLYHIGKG